MEKENGQNSLKFRACEFMIPTAAKTVADSLVSKIGPSGIQIIPKPAGEMDFLKQEGNLKSKITY